MSETSRDDSYHDATWVYAADESDLGFEQAPYVAGPEYTMPQASSAIQQSTPSPQFGAQPLVSGYALGPHTGQQYLAEQCPGRQYPVPQDFSGRYQQMTQYPDHPSSTPVLILGILGFVVWITAPIGWILGAKAKKEIKRGAPYRDGGALTAGYILSIVSTVLLAFYAFLVIIMVVVLNS